MAKSKKQSRWNVEREKPTGPVTKADIQRKLQELSGGLEEGADQGRRFGPWVVGAFAAIAIIYRLGLITGSRQAPQLEIRRITQGG
jgi:hypothetical protein